jgi:signal transduction histidine kinase
MEPMVLAIVAIVAIVFIGILVFMMTRGQKKSRSSSSPSPNAALADKLANIAKELEEVSREIDIALETDEETFSNPGKKMSRYENMTIAEIFNGLDFYINHLKLFNDEVKIRFNKDQGLESDKALMESMLNLSRILATITVTNKKLPQLIKETKKKIKADQNTTFSPKDLKDINKEIRSLTTPLSYLVANFISRVNDEIRSRPSFCSNIAIHTIDASMNMPPSGSYDIVSSPAPMTPPQPMPMPGYSPSPL